MIIPDYTLKKYVIQQNKVIQVNDAENKFVLFHEKDFWADYSGSL